MKSITVEIYLTCVPVKLKLYNINFIAIWVLFLNYIILEGKVRFTLNSWLKGLTHCSLWNYNARDEDEMMHGDVGMWRRDNCLIVGA